MGCDGGTIPKRHELVKGPKKVEKVDKNAELIARWYYCTLSQEKLRRPVVACELGRLYNKDAVIEYLLDKSSDKPIVEAASHIRSIKDVKELNLSDNPAWKGDKGDTKGDQYDDLHCTRFICPVVGVEMNGRHRFCFLYRCGCVFSERALKEVKTDVCHKCGVPFQDDDIIHLNGSKEEVGELRKKMEERKLKAKLEKKAKKSNKSKAAESAVRSSCMTESAGPSKLCEEASGQSSEEKNSISDEKAPGNGSSSSLVKSCKAATKRSAPSDKSEAYKSIFTSHCSAKRTKEQMSHWVTHTAYYF